MKMDIVYLIMLLSLVGALYFGAMAHIAKYSWYDVKLTGQFTFSAIGFTIVFIILTLVYL